MNGGRRANDLMNELKWISEGGSQAGLAPTAAVKGIRTLGRRALIFEPQAHCCLVRRLRALAVWNLKPSPTTACHSLHDILCRRANNWQVWITALPWPFLPMALISPMSLARAVRSSFTCGRWIVLEAKPIPGTEGAVSPFFSPDGQWVGFFAGGKLKKVSVSGGAAMTLGDAANPCGASWGSQGIIAFAPTQVQCPPASAGRQEAPRNR